MGRANSTAVPSNSTRRTPSTKKEFKEFIDNGTSLITELINLSPEAKFPLSSRQNGRSASLDAEKAFLSCLQKEFAYKGKTARVLTSMPSIGWKKNHGRFWLDFAIDYDGKMYPYNFKYGRGEKPDNVGSLKTLAYLMGNDVRHPLTPSPVKETDLAKMTGEILSGRSPKENYNLREYFCVFFNSTSETEHKASYRVIPVSQISEDDLVFNNQNGLQINFAKAEAKKGVRSREEVKLMFAKKLKSFFEKRAAPFELIESMEAKKY